MNTPAHVAINLMLLTREPDYRKTAAVIGGALIPDLAIIAFYAWQLWLGTAEDVIWSTEYYRPFWQAWIDSFNSIPLVTLALVLGWYLRWPLLLLIAASMLLHIFADLPLHHDDAHRHFFPLLEWRFESPVSYWDPAHYGNWASLFEISAVTAASIFLYRRYLPLRPWVIGIFAIYLLYWGYVWMVWM